MQKRVIGTGFSDKRIKHQETHYGPKWIPFFTKYTMGDRIWWH